MSAAVPPAVPSGRTRGLWRNREFVGLQAAEVVSVLGDQLARVALAVLVFRRTGSPALTAATYAVSYAPALLGGPLLAGLADRLPRRRVLIGCDLARAGLVGLTAVPGVPLTVLLLLLFGVGLVSAPFRAARGPALRDAVGVDLLSVASGIDQAAYQAAQLAGYAVGGVLVAATGTRGALLVDVATFLLSALLFLVSVPPRPATGRAEGARPGLLALAGADAALGWRTVMDDRLTRRAVLLTWVGLGAVVVPEALAAPWAAHLGAGPVGLGVLLLAIPAGAVPGFLVASREGHGVREDPSGLLVRLLALALAPLLVCSLDPPLPAAVALLIVSGTGSAHVVVAQVLVSRRTPSALLGRVGGVAGAGLTLSQGLYVVGGGLVAELVRPPWAVGALAAVALAAAVLVMRGTRAPATVADVPPR